MLSKEVTRHYFENEKERERQRERKEKKRNNTMFFLVDVPKRSTYLSFFSLLSPRPIYIYIWQKLVNYKDQVLVIVFLFSFQDVMSHR